MKVEAKPKGLTLMISFCQFREISERIEMIKTD